MGSENKSSIEAPRKVVMDDEEEHPEPSTPFYLVKFKLYETRSNFYMVGRDKSKRHWRVLKIDRSEPSELIICEDPTIYSSHERTVLLRRVSDGNRHTGGLKFVTTCYGIVGIVKFLGPYYLLLITERRKVGMICGHAIYAVSKSKMIPIPHSTVRSNMDISKDENRYKKLLCALDITKDFYFSYSYHIMHSLQTNTCQNSAGMFPYENMFVWNAFLSRAIRNYLGNTLWTVALIHGFFKQVKLTNSGCTFNVTLIARRSRHYAGTRYLKRGVNRKGRAANDVETEQIVFEDVPDGCPPGISSVVQNRGSIPLFWSQETSPLTIKPDIILSKEDPYYEATQLHFQNLFARYGNPIIILNLIKKQEKKPRESILHAEYIKAVTYISRSLAKDERLEFLALDLNKLFRLKGPKVLTYLNRVAVSALDDTGFFYCQIPQILQHESPIKWSSLEIEHASDSNSSRFQSGVLRTNCIDCLDRTNVAQYAYGLVALGNQLHALGITHAPEIDVDDPLAYKLMSIYEAMGDTLALQYGGSAAHNKIFSERRGQWKAATQSQECLRTLQRYWSNVYMDAIKQDAIYLFLGQFLPEVGSPALWELDADQRCNIESHTPSFSEDISRSSIRRSLSDNILCESRSPMTPADMRDDSSSDNPLSDVVESNNNKGISDSTPEISTSGGDAPTSENSTNDNDVSYSRYNPAMSARQLFTDISEMQCLRRDCNCTAEHRGGHNFSIIHDLDWMSSSENSCEEDAYDRSSLLGSPNAGSSHGQNMTEMSSEVRGYASHRSSGGGFNDSFKHWVEYGGILIP